MSAADIGDPGDQRDQGATGRPLPWSARLGWALAVLLLSVAGLALRWSGIDWQLPAQREADPAILLQTAELTAGERGPWAELATSRYPWLLARANVLLSARADLRQRAAAADTLDEHLAAASAGHARARRFLALLSCLVLPATWFLARAFLGRGASLLAMAFVATSLFHLHFSTQAKPHGAVTAASALALVAALALLRTGRWWTWIAAGLAAGVAIGCLHNGVFALGPLGVAALLDARRRGWRRLLRLAVPLLLAGGLGAWSYQPPAFYDAPRTRAEGTALLERDMERATEQWERADLTGHLVRLDVFQGRGFGVLVKSLYGYDPWLVGLAVAGLAAAARVALGRRRRSSPGGPGPGTGAAWVVASFALPPVLVFGLYDASMPRYFLPLVPVVAVLGAGGVQVAATWLAGRLRWIPPAGLLALLAAVNLIVPTALALKLVHLRRAPDTLSRASRWLAARVEPGESVFVGDVPSLPVFQHPATLGREDHRSKSIWQTYQANQRPARARDEGLRIRRLTLDERSVLIRLPRREEVASLVELLEGEGHAWALVVEPPTEPASWRFADQWRRSLVITIRFTQPVERAGGRRVAVFEPYGEAYREHGGGGPVLGSLLGRSPARDVWRAEALGPRIEVYRLP